MDDAINASPGTTGTTGNTGNATPHAPHRTHPLVIAASAAVIVFSLLGVAAMTGVIPSAFSEKTPDAAPVAPIVNGAERHASSRTTTRAATPASPATTAATCANCGVVESVRQVEVKGSGSGLGAVAGGITGAVVGNQIGRGNGNTAMTILGAAGGAFAGNEIEKNVKKQVTWRVTIRMDDGSYRTVSQSSPVNVGEKVRVVNGALVARS